MNIITILNLKGGVAKTTTALNVAEALRTQNKKVLLIDLDYQKSLTILNNVNHKITALELLQEPNNKDLVEQALDDDIITAHEDLLTIDNLEPTRLKNILKQLNNKYDYVVIDNHCIFNTLVLNSLIASDTLIIPTTCNRLGYVGVDDMINLLQLINKVYKKNLNSYLLITDFRKCDLNIQYKEILEELIKDKNIKLVNTIIRYSQPIEDSQALGQNLFTYSKRSNGSKDYLEATKEIFNLN